MDWSDIKDSLGLKGKVTDDNAAKKIAAAFDARPTGEHLAELGTALKLSGEVTAENVVGQVTEVMDALRKQAEAKGTKVPPHPEVIRLSRANGELRLKELVAAGRVDPNTATKLTNLYLSDDALTLSLADGGQNTTFESLMDVLVENKPVPLGGKTGPQVLKLSDAANDDADADILVKEMESRSA